MRVCNAFFLALTLTASAASAQVAFSLDDCDPDEILAAESYAPEWQDLYPKRVFQSLLPQMDAGEWGAASRALAESFRESGTVPAGGLRETVQRNLDQQAEAFARAQADPTFLASGDGVTPERFRIFFSDDGSPLLFSATDDEVDMADLDGAVRRDVCWRAFAAHRVGIYSGEEARKGAVAALDRVIGLWTRYNENSYSLYPWELAVNGLLSGPREVTSLADLEPPRTQVVLLHPGIAFEAAGFGNSLDSLRRLDVLTFEPIGILRYNESRTSFIGLSALVTIPADARFGVGGLVHFGEAVQVGVVYRGGESRGAGIVLTTDVFKLLQGAPSSLRERVRSLVGARDAIDE